MTVRRRLIGHALLMLLGIAGLSTIAITAVAHLRDDYSIALAANEQLRTLYTIGTHLAAARSAATEPNASSSVQHELYEARGLLELSAADLARLPRASVLRQAIVDAQENPTSIERGLNRAYTGLADASANVRQAIAAQQAAADRRHRLTLWAISLIAAATLAAMLLLTTHHYRLIIHPLRDLRDAVKRLAGGDFASRAALHGDADFVSLARHFNDMADELASAHAQLEQRVAVKTRELSQAQRLASIGYLAAGVAHEINNPLGIIAGYGQRTLRRLDVQDVDADRIKQTLGVICDEAFRCKKITDRLLMLARPTPTQRQTINLSSLIQDTIASLTTLRPLEGRQIESHLHATQPLTIDADADALRQVLLNLLINAVEATLPRQGRITIDTSRVGDAIEVTVSDNGRGIAAERLPHIFEPFVTDQRSLRPGTGLGLAIALSIVSDHGGSLTATSGEADQGSVFCVTLPISSPQT